MNKEYIGDAWSSLLDADLNSRYWRLMALRYARRERNAKIFLAAAASATVASWSIWAELKWLWQTLSSVSALISLTLPIVDASGKIEAMTDAQTGWLRLVHEYEELWRIRNTLDAPSFSKKFAALKDKEVDLSRLTAKLPSDDTRLADVCYADVLKSRGLS